MSNTITITFTEEAYKAAEEARTRRGLPFDQEFYEQGGPTFNDVERVDDHFTGFIRLELTGGITYMYNVNSIARIKVVEAE